MISKNLINLREKKNLNKKQLAVILGISESTYGKYELGKRMPDIPMLVKIANFHNVSIDSLIDRKITTKIDKIVPFNKNEQEVLNAFNRVDSANQSKMLMTLKTAFPEAFNNYPEGFIYPAGFVDMESAKNYYEKTASYTAAFEGTDLVDEEYIELANNLVRSEFNIK